jgi:ribosomal protein S18 acetylase RimI-like enzyme
VTVAGAEAVAVRFAALADDARLAAIDEETWSTSVTPAPRPAERRFFRRQVEPADTLVAEVGGDVVGYALLGPAAPIPASAHVQMLRGLAVDPAFQGRGVGRLLVEAAIREAGARGAVKLRLRVLGSNAGARRLYRACGFETEGVLRDEFRLDGRPVDDHLLARRLDR